MISVNSPNKQIILPFLKWAGGKRWLVNSGISYAPDTYANYHEPFLGGGAACLSLPQKNGVLADLNGDLIITYNAIKSDWQNVESEPLLSHLAKEDSPVS